MNINAEFRALKQLSGLTSQHIADKFDVGLRTVQPVSYTHLTLPTKA